MYESQSATQVRFCHILTSEYIDDLEFYPLFYLCTYKKKLLVYDLNVFRSTSEVFSNLQLSSEIFGKYYLLKFTCVHQLLKVVKILNST